MTRALAILVGLLDQHEPFACCNVKVVMSAVTVTRSSRVTSRPNPGSICIELASPEDWHALSELERASFPGDRISPRSWRAFLSRSATDARGRAVSKALLEDATQRMRDAGAAVLRLETRLDNVAAPHLFAKCGFVQRGPKASYRQDGEDALLDQKSLWHWRAAETTAVISTILARLLGSR